MKKIILITALVCSVVVFTGCETTGLSSRECAGVSYPKYILSAQTGSTNAPAPLPKLPLKLAVAQVGEVAPPQGMIKNLEGDKSIVASVIALPMPADNNTGFCGPVKTNGYDYAGNLKNLCRLARSAGAEQLFVVGGNIETRAQNNIWSVFDWTIIGAYFVPGSRIHAEGKGAGTLIDVASGEPMVFVSVDAKDSSLSPDMLVDGKAAELRARLRDRLTEDLAAALLKKISATH